MKRPLFHILADLLYPPRCLFCGEPVPLRGGCTAACSKAADAARLAPNERTRSAPNLQQLSGLVCSFRYNDVIAESVARYKFRGYGQHRFPMAQYLAADVEEAAFYPAIDAVTWVPSWQSESRHGMLLAKETARLLQLPAMQLLVKTRKTQKQHKLGHAERAKNLVGAFAVPAPAAVKGRHILIVDDVLTTGSTLCACADALLAAGAASVSAAAFSRAEGQSK